MAGRGEDFGRVDQQFEQREEGPAARQARSELRDHVRSVRGNPDPMPGAKPRGQSHVPVRRADANESSVSHASHPSVAVDVAFV